jgi:serine/threonine protein kinase
MADDEKTVVLGAPDTVMEGTQLSGTYELDARIASGGMGEVYRGHNIQTGDPVAIKIVLPELARDATILALFRKEASILNHLFHEAIVRYHVFAIDQTIGRPYLAMEFVDGVSLVDMMKTGPMSAEAARKLLIRLASGLAVAHEAGIVHRDLSPDNVILPGGKVERAKIIDFGIARSASVGGETLLGGTFAGKYNYVSPEQLGMAGGEVTEKSDVYSLGLVIGAALRGQPFNMSGSQVDIIEKRRTVPDLTGIDPQMRPILDSMLQPYPANRPDSMQAIVDWLRAIDPARGFTLPPSMTEPPGGTGTGVPASAPPWTMPPAPLAGTPAAAVGDAPAAPAALSAGPAPSSDASGAAPPVSESPFGPYTGPERPIPPETSRAPDPFAPVARPKKGRGGLVGMGVAALLVVAASGAYVSGALDGLIGRQAEEPVTPPPPNEPTTPPSEPTTPEPPAEPDETPPPQQQPAEPPVEPPPQQPAEPPPQEPQPQPPSGEPQPPDETPPPAEPEPQPQPPPREEVEGPGAVDGAARRVAWLNQYQGGDCFYATAVSAAGEKTEIEGFGQSVQPFQDLLRSFTREFNLEPEIGVRLIRQKQCPVTEFLRTLKRDGGEPPDLTLAKYELANRDPMSGEMELIPNRQSYLLLVDHDGIVHNLESVLRRAGGKATFNIALGLGTGQADGDAPVPQVVVALSTAAPMETLKGATSVPAATLLPRLLDEIASKRVDAEATARYLRIRQ